MEEKSHIENLIDDTKEYVELRYDLFKLNTSDKISSVLSEIACLLVLGVVGLFVLFFSSAGVAWWIGQALDNPSIGYFIVAAFYILLGVIIYNMRNTWIKIPIINNILKKLHYHED